MRINIIDLKRRVKNDFDIESDLILFKNYGSYQYFYIPNYRGYLHVFMYDVKSDYLKIEYLIELPRDLDIEFVEVLDIDDRRKDVYFTIYENSENYLLGLYKYSQIAEYMEIILRGEYTDIIYINNEYSILTYENEAKYLVEYENKKIYDFCVDSVYNLDLSNLSLVKLDGKGYLYIIDSSYDEYDIDEYFYKLGSKIEPSSISYIELDKFIEDIKELNLVRLNIIKESKSDSYIFPVEVNEKEDENKREGIYSFYEINYTSRKLYLYSLKLDNGELVYELEHIEDLSGLGNLYNLFIHVNPLEISKIDDTYLGRKVRILYPKQKEINMSYKESYLGTRQGMDIFWFWEEPENSNEYYTGIRIKDPMGNLYMEIRGEGLVLEDNKILIYESINLNEWSYFIEGNNRYYTDMADVLKSIEGSYKNYNWLITNIETNADDLDLLERLDIDYLYLSGDEFKNLLISNDIQWINARFTGFDKNRSKEEILESLESVLYDNNINEYFKELVSLQHPLSIVEIIAHDSNRCMIVSENEALIKSFKAYYPDAQNLEFDNKLRIMQEEEIKSILKESGIDNEGIIGEIWRDLFKTEYSSPEFYISEIKIKKYLDQRGKTNEKK